MSIRNLIWMLILTVVLGSAFFLRVSEIQQFPPGLSNDEAINTIDAFHIASSGNFPMYEEDEGRAEPLYRIVLAGATALFGPDIWTMRLISAFLGLLTIAACAWLVHEAVADLTTEARRIAVLAAVVALVVMVGHVTLSRTLFRATIQLLLVALSSAAILRALRLNSRFLATVAGTLAGLSLYTYTAIWAYPPAFVVLGITRLLFQRHRWRQWLPLMLIFGISAVLVASPVIYLLLTNTRLVLGRAEALTGPALSLGETIRQAVDQFFSMGDENPQYNVALAPIISPLWQPLFILGLAALLIRIRTRSALFVLALLLLFNVPAIASNEITHGLRIANTYIVVAVIIGTGAGVITAFLLRWIPSGRLLYPLLTALLLLVLVVDSGRVWRMYESYWTAPDDWRLWRIFDRELNHNEWFFRTDRQDFAAWIAAQDDPLLIPVSELQQQTTRAWLLDDYPVVRGTPPDFRLPTTTRLVIPWELSLGGPQVHDRAFALLDSGVVTLLPHLTADAHARLVADLSSADTITRSGDVLTTLAYTRPIPDDFVLEFAPPGSESDAPLASFADGELELVSWYGPDTLDTYQPLNFSLMWQAQRRIGHEYASFLQILTRDYERIAGSEHLIHRWLYPTTIWPAGELVPDHYTVTIPAGVELAPGAYRLGLGIYYANYQRMPAASLYAPGLADLATIGWLKVAPQEMITIPTEAVATEAVIAEQIALDGVLMQPDGSGGWELHLYWHSLVDRPDFEGTIFVHLVDANGQIVAQHDSQPWAGQYPTFIWDKGEVVRTGHPLQPENVSLDGLTLRLGMYTLPGPRNLPARLADEPLPDGIIILGDAVRYRFNQ